MFTLLEGRTISSIFLVFNVVPSDTLGMKETKYTNIFQKKKAKLSPKGFVQSCTHINTERYQVGEPGGGLGATAFF